MAFLAMLGLMFLNNSICKDVNKALALKASMIKGLKEDVTSGEIPEGVHAYEYADGETKDARAALIAESADLPIEIDGTWKEAFCSNQESTVAQMAIAVLLLTAVRVIMTKGQ